MESHNDKELKGQMDVAEEIGDHGNKQILRQNNSQGLLEPGGHKETLKKKQSTDDVDCQRLDCSRLEEGEIDDSPDEIDMTPGKHKTNTATTLRITADQRTKRSPDRYTKRRRVARNSRQSSSYALGTRQRSPIASTSRDVYMSRPVYDGSGKEKNRITELSKSQTFDSAVNKVHKRKWCFEGWKGPKKRRFDDNAKKLKRISTDIGRVHEYNKGSPQGDSLDTVLYSMRPCRLNDDNVATNLAKLQTYLRSNDECPKLTQLLTVLKNCAQANNLHWKCKLKIMDTLRTCKFFERKDVIGLLTEPDAISLDFIENLLLVMTTMVHSEGLEERDAPIAFSLLKRSSATLKNVEPKINKLIMKIEDVFAQKKMVGKNFARTLPVLPDIKSIRSRHQVVIPKHEVSEGFADELSYVSYMFVLLREDFVRPLVMGIRSYIDQTGKGAPAKFYNSDVRCYERVRILSTSTTIENGIVWRIQLNSNFRKKSQMPSILQYGSLLCLSHDGFRTIHYATVANSDPVILKNGQIEIKFFDACTVNTNMLFVMIESRAFYESCSHTLKYLKQLSEEVEQNGFLPMGKYLVHLTKDIDPPKYLNDFSVKSLMFYGNGHHAADHFSSDDNLGSDTGEDNHYIPCEGNTLRETLTSAEQVGLDTSQYEALQLVLNNEIALVQGPPGTGKTMMGVRIAEFFLANKKDFSGIPNWLSDENKKAFFSSPCLLASYTNHALDQFLQLLLETQTMRGCQPWEVVRVGSRCEVEKLQKFMLKKHRHQRRHDIESLYFHSMKDRMIHKNKYIEELKRIKSLFMTHLVHEETLMEYQVIDDRHIRQLQNNQSVYDIPVNITVLFEWLRIHQFRHSVHSDYETRQKVNCKFDVLWMDDRKRLLDNENDLINGENVSTQVLDFNVPKLAVTYSLLQEHAFFKDLDDEKLYKILWRLEEEIGRPDKMSYSEMSSIKDIWKLRIHDKWRLYRYWVHTATEPISEKIQVSENEFNTERQKYIEARNSVDFRIMKTAAIVALTTTAAAKYTGVLKKLAAPIVIIEEAAQASEQHVLSTMSKSCQHLIMIGDHQQLKPAYNDYLLAKEYHTDVSLFERLVQNQFPYKQLQKQHRMRPEISTLLVPHIYEKLDDDESVFNYPDVRGMASNVYFISHNVPEDNGEQSLSHSNKYEAEYLSQLYRYLRLQGYRSKDITVLTMYTDQVRILRCLIKEVEISDITDNVCGENSQKGVRITTVDNFQGEENKIILLSLVRSNKKGKIGYLATENRICVSLSRAKEGLYVFGNMDCIRKKSLLWEQIISKAENNEACGKLLQLKCKKHASLEMMVSSPSDFKAFKNGGCSKPCTTRLKCGHACNKLCHTFDEDHALPCQMSCVKRCPRGHQHTIICGNGLPICTETVTVVMQTCGHDVKTECYINIFDVRCTHKCDNILSCGHKCQRKCGERCNTDQNCNELVKVTGKCGHTNQAACSKKTSLECRVPCSSTLDCGHVCKGTCGNCHSGRLHVPCRMKCERKLICGHICRAACSQMCPPCTQDCKVACKHRKCTATCGKECTECSEPCSWICKTYCQNKFKCTKLCHEVCNRERCNIPCRQILRDCRHRQRYRCIGLQCEECICRRCSDPVNFENEKDATFYRLPDCGHLFEVNRLDTYMDMPSESVCMKVCPRCKTPIIKAERYSNIVKSYLHDIQHVKQRLLTNENDLRKRKGDLEVQIHVANIDMKQKNSFLATLAKLRNNPQIDSLRTQFGFLLNVANLQRKVKAYKLKDKKRTTKLFGELDELSWVCLERFQHSDQETREFAMEMKRLRYYFRVSVMQENIAVKGEVPIKHTQWIKKTLEYIDGSKLDERNAEQIEKELIKLETIYPGYGEGIIDNERITILKVMDLSQRGLSYKCKNGHVYAISDCRGSKDNSRCPECSGVTEGGSQRLREDSCLAGGPLRGNTLHLEKPATTHQLDVRQEATTVLTTTVTQQPQQTQGQPVQTTLTSAKPSTSASGDLVKKKLSLTREQLSEAKEIFRTSNKATRPEKALILGFMAGSRDNPCPQHGHILNIRLSETVESVQLRDGIQKRMIADTYFQMNYVSGAWKRFKKFREISGE